LPDNPVQIDFGRNQFPVPAFRVTGNPSKPQKGSSKSSARSAQFNLFPLLNLITACGSFQIPWHVPS
jgi:hypothetical protein